MKILGYKCKLMLQITIQWSTIHIKLYCNNIGTENMFQRNTKNTHLTWLITIMYRRRKAKLSLSKSPNWGTLTLNIPYKYYRYYPSCKAGYSLKKNI